MRNTTDVPDGTDVNQFQLNGLDVLSAGLFYKNIGYFLVYTPELKESRGVVGQEATLEMANVVFSNIYTGWLNVRVGRMEPAYLAFSAKRRLTFSSYNIYDYAFPGGLALSDTQTGLEIYGQGRWAARGFEFGYAAGYMNGSETNQPDDGPQDYYGRAYVVIGAGEGQTAGQRIGAIAYRGQARSEYDPNGDRQCFTRYGFDASLNYGQWNLALQYLWGTDSKELWNATENGNFSGGFAELTWQPMTRLVLFGRYDSLNLPDFTDASAPGYTLGARFYLIDQLALHAEYSSTTLDFQSGSPTPDEKEEAFTLSVDFAF